MKTPTRITVAFDEETADLLEKIRSEMNLSQSEVMRRAVRFYRENKAIISPSVRKRLYTYIDMLLSGEHVILDIDHFLLFLNLIETSPEKDKFWKDCEEVARSHGEQLRSKVASPRDLLERLETCNFFRMNVDSESEFTLVLLSEAHKKFVKKLLEEFFKAMEFKAEIKEDFAKLRVRVK